MTQLFSHQASHPKAEAQANLAGRTHYADESTLRFHHARIVSANIEAKGLLFTIVEAVALDYQNTRRGYRFVIFDLFGNVIGKRVELEHAFKTAAQARKALASELLTLDPVLFTRLGQARHREQGQRDSEWLDGKIAEIAAQL